MRTETRSDGGFRYVDAGIDFASPAVGSLPGFAIERALLAPTEHVDESYEAARHVVERAGRPLSALCGLELHSPKATPIAEFDMYSRFYLSKLDAWGVLTHDKTSPLARTNVVPACGTGPLPVVVACSYTVPTSADTVYFVTAGTPEKPEGASHPEGIVRPGETSDDALQEKIRCVTDVLEGRVAAVGGTWDGTAEFHFYSARRNAFGLQRELLAQRRRLPRHGITDHFAAPPVDDLELEADVRRYLRTIDCS
jgi:hypothetical protein